ncbi:ATP-binding protein [Deltaproteobacteria bacterium TL4]
MKIRFPSLKFNRTYGLQTKLFCVFLLNAIVIVSLMAVIIRVNVAKNFEYYLHRVESQIYDAIVEELQEYYAQNQSWEPLRNQPWIFNSLVRRRIAETIMGTTMGPEHNPHRPWRLGRRVALLDENKELIFGDNLMAGNSSLREIEVQNKVVGWVKIVSPHAMVNPLDLWFLRRQHTAVQWIGAAILSVAAIVSLLLSRYLLSSVRALTAGTQALANRKFHTRIRVASSDEIGQLARDFNKMAETMEHYENQRRQWISEVSHELGTPLSILRGEIEAMQDGVREMNLQHLDSLHSEVLHISKIVDDLKFLSAAEAGGLTYQKDEIHPVRILKETLQTFEFRLQEKAIRIKFQAEDSGNAFIVGDRNRLKQVYSNLFENVLKYTQPSEILVLSSHQEEKTLHIAFEDSGPGVEDKYLPHLFDRFYRVEPSRNRVTGGSGLGLSICKNIIEAHQGEICAKKGSLGGLRIEIKLPIPLKLV